MVSAIIVAAGKGTRMGPKVDKLFLEVTGRPVVAHTWARFNHAACIDEIVLVVRDSMQPAFAELAETFHFKKPYRLVVGGKERQDSVWNGLQALNTGAEVVAIQDGARPCTTEKLIADTIQAAHETGAAVAGQRVTDTIKESADGNLIERVYGEAGGAQGRSPARGDKQRVASHAAVIIPDEIVINPERLFDQLASYRVSRIVLVPSLLRVLLDGYESRKSAAARPKFWISSGEVLSPELARRFQQLMPDCVLLNLYGSSEVAADVTWHQVDKASVDTFRMPIGRPIANTAIYLLDKLLQPVPVGVAGEITAGGDGLARGYLHRSELTAAKFIPNPFSSEPQSVPHRRYRTLAT